MSNTPTHGYGRARRLGGVGEDLEAVIMATQLEVVSVLTNEPPLPSSPEVTSEVVSAPLQFEPVIDGRLSSTDEKTGDALPVSDLSSTVEALDDLHGTVEEDGPA